MRMCSKCGQPIQEYQDWGGWSVDLSRNTITGHGTKARVGPQVAVLMYLLVRDKGKVVPRERLMFGIWGNDPPLVADNQIQVLVNRLRHTIGRNAIGNTYKVGWYLKQGEADEQHA